jgi:hypothetical protein
LKNYSASEIGSYLNVNPSVPAIEIGMEMLTGVPAQAIRADSCTETRLEQILDWAATNNVGIVPFLVEICNPSLGADLN